MQPENPGNKDYTTDACLLLILIEARASLKSAARSRGFAAFKRDNTRHIASSIRFRYNLGVLIWIFLDNTRYTRLFGKFPSNNKFCIHKMSIKSYLPLQSALHAGAFIVLALAVVFLVAAIAGWRGPFRKKRLVRFALCLGAVPMFPLIHAALLYGVVFPYEARQGERLRQERIDAVSFVNIGDAAPSFSITDTTGATFILDDLRGKVALVNFFATWCGPCLLELPHIQELWDDNRDKSDFALIVIGREETNESVTAFQSKHAYSFPMASDPERSVYSLYAKEIIPRTYLVSRDGKICFASTGFYEEDMAKLQRELGKQLRSTQ